MSLVKTSKRIGLAVVKGMPLLAKYASIEDLTYREGQRKQAYLKRYDKKILANDSFENWLFASLLRKETE